MSESLLYPAKLETVVVPDKLQTLARLGRQLLDIASFETEHAEISSNPYLVVFDEVPEMSRALWRLPVVNNQYQHEHMSVSVVNSALIIAVSSLKPYMDGHLMPRSSLVMERNLGKLNESEPLRPVSRTTRLPDDRFDYFADRLDEVLDLYQIELIDVETKKVG